MSMYRVYKDDDIHYIVSTDGTLKKMCKYLYQDTWVAELQAVPQEELTTTWNDIVSRMVNKARQEERDRILSNIKNSFFNH